MSQRCIASVVTVCLWTMPIGPSLSKGAPRQEPPTRVENDGARPSSDTKVASTPGLLPVDIVAELLPGARPQHTFFAGDDVVATLSRGGQLEAFSLRSGQAIWTEVVSEELLPPLVSPAGVLAPDRQGTLRWFSPESGERLRELPLAVPLEITPGRDGGTLYLVTAKGDVIAYDVDRGREAWRRETDLRPRSLGLGGGLLVIADGEGTLLALDVAEGHVRWSFRAREGFDAAPVFDPRGERLYVGDMGGTFYCLEAGSGRKRYQWSTGAAIHMPALVESDRAFVVSYANSLFAYRAGSGDELFRVALPARPASPPVRVGTRLVVATWDGLLVEIDPDRGKLAQPPQRLGGHLLLPPVFRAPWVAITLRSGKVLVLRKSLAPASPPTTGEGARETSADDERESTPSPVIPPEGG